ncbi:ABC transporter ATP-binding protein [Pilimelia terevasa]|uniref:ABC transporter ATP-binding protein n=1 Tax=Pilimelia terevasa TaxID=53372 RepID=A0A8J3FI64_9ACTN|nr:ABC transporter ATP-binding protein [Pilimelia terevasa]GGK17545.1 ABC transporter ATP-binding protein [Pilimelia terevasa]
MADGRIVVSGLTKRYGTLAAVADLSFTVEPGRVTGFLGPNGAGKSTTLRIALGLSRPTSGTATINGSPYRALREPARQVGAVLEASCAHPGRSGRDHLRVICAAAGLPAHRTDEVLAVVGLSPAARRRVKGYSLGMLQRLGIAAALLGDPRVLILDEPANGLDPEGIHWLRALLRTLAGQGRTVLVSSHLLAEMQLLADDVVIIAGGRLVRQGPVADVVTVAAQPPLRIRAPQADALTRALAAAGAAVTAGPDGALRATGIDAPTVARTALAAALEIHELTPEAPDLERAFLDLTAGRAEVR